MANMTDDYSAHINKEIYKMFPYSCQIHISITHIISGLGQLKINT
jgi:hypothetical protein